MRPLACFLLNTSPMPSRLGSSGSPRASMEEVLFLTSVFGMTRQLKELSGQKRLQDFRNCNTQSTDWYKVSYTNSKSRPEMSTASRSIQKSKAFLQLRFQPSLQRLLRIGSPIMEVPQMKIRARFRFPGLSQTMEAHQLRATKCTFPIVISPCLPLTQPTVTCQRARRLRA